MQIGEDVEGLGETIAVGDAGLGKLSFTEPANIPGAQQDYPQLQQQREMQVNSVAQQQEVLSAMKLQQTQYRDYIISSIRITAGIDAPDGSSSSISTAEGLALVQKQLAPYAHASNIPRLVESVYIAASAGTYLAALKAWAEAVRELERRCRDFQSCSLSPPGPEAASPPSIKPDPSLNSAPSPASLEAYSQAAIQVIEGLGASIYAASVADYYGAPVAQAAPILHAVAAAIRGRMQESRHALYVRLVEDLAHALEAVHWPPPLAPTPRGPDNAGLAGDADAERRASGEAASTASPGDAPRPPRLHQEFKGFSTDPARLAQLHALIACLGCLQQAVQPQEFQRLQSILQQANASSPETPSPGIASQALEEVPVLWAASAVLVPPLQARLQAHFAPSAAAGRLDRPEWLFQTVLRLVQEHVGHVACLQPGLASAGLSGHCHMAVEYARAMRDATKVVLRTARLPALQELWDQDKEEVAGELWRQQVREAIEFEAKLAPFLGAPQSVLATRVLPDPLLDASILRAITDDPEYMAVWIAVERQSALAHLQEVMGDPKAWMPPPQDDEDQQAGPGIPPAPHAQGGWQQEFNPPQVAEALVDIVSSVVDISRSTPNAEAQKALLDGVGGPLLEAMTERLSELLEQAASSNSILSEAWAPRVGACVAAARYLHHMLSEMLEGPALSRLHAAAAAAKAAGTQVEALPGTEQQQQQQLPAASSTSDQSQVADASNMMVSQSKGGMGDVVVRHSFTPALLNPPVLAAGVASLGSLHREWGLRIAQELALTFGRAAVGYKEAVESAESYPTHTGAAGTVTPILEPAMALLQAGLHALAPSLDGPSFRDIWRAVTVPVNRFLFNYVATEAFFSPAGAHQFAVDCAGMVAVFSPFTKRPAAHFREMLAAARLLTLGDQETQEVVRKASTQAAMGEPLWREPWLAQLGVGCLSAQQVIAVVERRV